MKINEELIPYEKGFHYESIKIKFFCSTLKEIKFQIKNKKKICGKELEIYEKQSSNLPILINMFNENIFKIFYLGIGDWGLGIGDWGLGIGPNPQSPFKIFLFQNLI